MFTTSRLLHSMTATILFCITILTPTSLLAEDELGARLAASDDTLNLAYQELLQRLSENQQGLLREAQRNWISFRDLAIETTITACEDKDMIEHAEIKATIKLTDERTKHLKSYLAIENIPNDIPERDIVMVDSVGELLDSIQPGRTIILLPGDYRFGEVQSGHDDILDYLEDSLCFKNLENLSIVGVSPAEVAFSTARALPNGILFQNCRNLNLQNISFGKKENDPQNPYYRFQDCSKIKIDNCKIEGTDKAVAVSNCSEICWHRCVFLGCNAIIATITDSQDISFTNTVFKDNPGHFIFNNSAVTITNGRFFNEIAQPLFELDETAAVTVDTTLLPVLDTALLTNRPELLHLNGCLDDEATWVVKEGESIVEEGIAIFNNWEGLRKTEYYEVDPYLNIKTVVVTDEQGIRDGGTGGIYVNLYRITSKKMVSLGGLFGYFRGLTDIGSKVVMRSIPRGGGGIYGYDDYVLKDRTQPQDWFEFNPYCWDLLCQAQQEERLSDKRLNLLYTYGRSHVNENIFATLKKTQRAWLQYRDAKTQFVGSLYSEPIETVTERLRIVNLLTQERSNQLSRTIHNPNIPKSIDQQEVVTISSYSDLVRAIGSNKHILMQPGEYEVNGDWLEIKDIHNMTIAGTVPGDIVVLASRSTYPALVFRDCTNILLKNITAGHEPPGFGFCSGAVVELYDCENICLEGCDLYGCGLIGLESVNVNHLSFIDTLLRDCTAAGFISSNTSNISFTRTQFLRNGGGAASIHNTANTNATFFDCLFFENFTSTGKSNADKYGEILHISKQGCGSGTACSETSQTTSTSTSEQSGIQVMYYGPTMPEPVTPLITGQCSSKSTENAKPPAFTACIFVVSSPEAEQSHADFETADCIYEKSTSGMPLEKSITAVDTKFFVK